MMNFLVLGETGVEKSNFINGLVNYLKFGSMEEALNGEIDILIKSTVTIFDDNFQSREIIIEPTIAPENFSSTDEMLGKGQTAPQDEDQKSYVFRWGERGEEQSIRIIDTQGIGDLKGLDQDKKNFEKTLSLLSNFSEIHAICILIKPHSARLTLAFRFCIDELLIHLHNSASQNILFCFTNNRGTLYKPSDVLSILREHLSKLEVYRGIHIPLKRSTLFSFDNVNDSFRFLCTSKLGFSTSEKTCYAEGWAKSVEEARRLMCTVAELPGHRVEDTVCLNNIRSVINPLSESLEEIARIQSANTILIQEKTKEIEQLRAEPEKITSYCAEFAAFLSSNSVLPYNDSYGQYIEHLIREEREKVGAGVSDQMLKEVEKYKDEYEQQVRGLNESMRQQARRAVWMK